jgi:hypothetical protein
MAKVELNIQVMHTGAYFILSFFTVRAFRHLSTSLSTLMISTLLADNFIVLDGLTGANAKPKHFTSWFSEKVN